MTAIPYDDLAGARAATRLLIAHLDAVDLSELPLPSRLPGWSRAHVVAHLAGNAQSHIRMLDGCLAGEVRSRPRTRAGARAAWLSGRSDGSGLQVLRGDLPVPPPRT